jgi:hypothetical protein
MGWPGLRVTQGSRIAAASPGVMTSSTPSTVHASLAPQLTSRPCAMGLRTTTAYAIPGSRTFATYRARPVSSRASSRRGVLAPT